MMIKTRRTGATFAFAAALLAWGCSDLSVQGGGPLDITLAVSQTSAAVGTEIEFSFVAQGTSLSGVILDYGDGSALDSIPTSGAQSASGRRQHTYGDAGLFQMTGTVEDAVQGTFSRQLSIEVTPPTPAPGG
jgi:hypothetical protein